MRMEVRESGGDTDQVLGGHGSCICLHSFSSLFSHILSQGFSFVLSDAFPVSSLGVGNLFEPVIAPQLLTQFLRG